MNGPGRADGAAEISGLSLRSLPVLARLFVKGGGKKNQVKHDVAQ